MAFVENGQFVVVPRGVDIWKFEIHVHQFGTSPLDDSNYFCIAWHPNDFLKNIIRIYSSCFVE